jgi:hypothetical protein
MESVPKSADLAAVFTALPGCHLVLLPDSPRFTIVEATHAYLSATYYRKEDIMGQGIFEAFTDNPDNPLATGVKNLSASLHLVVQHKKEHRMADQRYDVLNPATGRFEQRVWRPSNKPVLDSNGNLHYIIHTVEDITNTVQLQEATLLSNQKRQESENRFRSVVEQAFNLIFMLRGENMVLEEANDALFRIWNKDRSVIGKSLLEILPQTKEEGFFDLLQKVYFTGEAEHGMKVPATLLDDGKSRTLYFNFTYQPLRNSRGEVTHVMVIAHDVTEQVLSRKAMEETRAETERQKRLYEAVTASTPDLIYVFDLDYLFIYANEALLTMWGKTADQAIGKGLAENGYEPWHADMHNREIDQVVATRQPVRGEVSFPHAVLGRRLYDYIFVPVINKEGNVEAVAGTTRDITEIKQAEEVMKQASEKLEALVAERTKALQRSNKELEDFAYAASHDLKEPIRKIHFFADRLKQRLAGKLEDEDRRYFERLEMSSRRMNSLIEDLLVYSHVSRGRSTDELVDLNQTLSFVLDDLELHMAEKDAQVDAEPLPTIRGHQRQLQQLYENLIGNGLKYSLPEVVPQITIRTEVLGGSALAEKRPALHGDKTYHLVQVSDNGIGFPQEDAERIFNVFTRLHGNAEYRGSGVGLSIAQKVVQNHGGAIWAESNEGNGATFKMVFPVD